MITDIESGDERGDKSVGNEPRETVSSICHGWVWLIHERDGRWAETQGQQNLKWLKRKIRLKNEHTRTKSPASAISQKYTSPIAIQ